MGIKAKSGSLGDLLWSDLRGTFLLNPCSAHANSPERAQSWLEDWVWLELFFSDLLAYLCAGGLVITEGIHGEGDS